MRKIIVFGLFLCIAAIAAAQSTTRLTVDSRVIWGTTVFVPANHSLKVTAISGSWSSDPSFGLTDYRGSNYTCAVRDCREILLNVPNGSLIYRTVVLNGAIAMTETLCPISRLNLNEPLNRCALARDRWVQFSINDDVTAFADNRGSLQLEVTISQPTANSGAAPPQPSAPTAANSDQPPPLKANQPYTQNGMTITLRLYGINNSQARFGFEIKNSSSSARRVALTDGSVSAVDNLNRPMAAFLFCDGSKSLNGYAQNGIIEINASLYLPVCSFSDNYFYITGDFFDPTRTYLLITFREDRLLNLSATWRVDLPQ